MNRRALLKAMPAALVAGAVPVAAAEETPVMRAYREWEKLRDVAERDGNTGDDAHDEPYWTALYSVGDRMQALPCQSGLDWVAKALSKTHQGDVYLDDARGNPALWAEARALLA